VAGAVAGAIEVGRRRALLVQPCDPALRALDELVVGPELDRVGRARLRAGGLEAVLEAVVAQRALRGSAVVVVAVDDAERARGHAVAAPVADVRLQDDGLELRPDQRPGGARVEAARVRAVLAHVGHEHPAAGVAQVPAAVLDGRDRGQLGERLQRLDEAHVAPGVRPERAGVVVGAALAELGAVGGQVVPLLAGHLARLAPDAHRRVGEEAHAPALRAVDGELGHRFGPSAGWSWRGETWRSACAPRSGAVDERVRRPARTSHVNALASSIVPFGSPDSAIRSLAVSPGLAPA